MGCGASSARVGERPKAAGDDRGLLKVLVVGARGAGKTAVWRRYVKEEYVGGRPPGSPRGEEARRPALGLKHIVGAGEGNVTLEVWDVPCTASEDAASADLYTEGACGVVVVTDATKPRTFQEVGVWVDALRRRAEGSRRGPPPLLLLANKSDHRKCVMSGDEVVESASALGADAGRLLSCKTEPLAVAEEFESLFVRMLRWRDGAGDGAESADAG